MWGHIPHKFIVRIKNSRANIILELPGNEDLDNSVFVDEWFRFRAILINEDDWVINHFLFGSVIRIINKIIQFGKIDHDDVGSNVANSDVIIIFNLFFWKTF